MPKRRSEAERLNREATKGRRSLRGLDRAGFAASLDAVLEGRVEAPTLTEARYAKTFRSTANNDENGAKEVYAAAVAYARVTHCPADIVGAMMVAFPDFSEVVVRKQSREAAPGSMGGAGGFVDVRDYVLIPAFAIMPTLTLFRAIWPDVWREFTAKYLHGYTQDAIYANWVDKSIEACNRHHRGPYADPYGIRAHRNRTGIPCPGKCST